MYYTIHVSNIDVTIKAPDLMRLFGGYGEVKKVVVLESMKPRFALVQMACEEHALAAVQATNGHPLNEQPLRVEAFFISSPKKGEPQCSELFYS